MLRAMRASVVGVIVAWAFAGLAAGAESRLRRGHAQSQEEARKELEEFGGT